LVTSLNSPSANITRALRQYPDASSSSTGASSTLLLLLLLLDPAAAASAALSASPNISSALSHCLAAMTTCRGMNVGGTLSCDGARKFNSHQGATGLCTHKDGWGCQL
jgi:hypothetical protein